jgi:hypothetical protein
MNPNNPAQKLKLSHSLLITIAVLLLIIAAVALFSVLGVTMWIPFLGMALWTAFGAPFKFRDIASLWASEAAALFLGYLVANMGEISGLAFIVMVIGLFAMVFCIVSGWLSFVFNARTFIFFTVSTALLIGADPLRTTLSLAVGFALFGLLPFGIGLLLKRRFASKPAE